jgi:hypothetical protein
MIKSNNKYIVSSLCGNYKKTLFDYNKAIILINNKDSIYYLWKIS